MQMAVSADPDRLRVAQGHGDGGVSVYERSQPPPSVFPRRESNPSGACVVTIHRTFLSIGLAVALMLSCAAAAEEGTSVVIQTAGESASGAQTPREVPGRLWVPGGGGLPAVIIVHGSAGPDSRGRFHRDYLVANGFAVLEIDMWAARGVTASSQRPKTTLDTLPDVWGAWLFLAAFPSIDRSKIAILGFSWGGVNAMATAFGKKPRNPPSALADARFAAHVAFYPSCDIWVKNGVASRVVDVSSPTGAPVQIHNGLDDDYDSDPRICERLKTDHPALPLDVFLYADAYHGFDSVVQKTFQFFDPVAKNLKGGIVRFAGNPKARDLAAANVLAFLSKVLK